MKCVKTTSATVFSINPALDKAFLLYKHIKLNILDNDDDENNNLDFDDEE